MVASLVTLYKKLKFVTDENVGWGPVDLPEIELQTTAYWLTADALPTRWNRNELDVALIGAGRAIQTIAAVLLMVDPRDLGLVAQVRSPHQDSPTIYLYEAVPGGIGMSERLWQRHEELIAGAADLIEGCACDAGCPACTGPRLEPDIDAKALALRFLHEVGAAARGGGMSSVTLERRLANYRAAVRPDPAPSVADQHRTTAQAMLLAEAIDGEVVGEALDAVDPVRADDRRAAARPRGARPAARPAAAGRPAGLPRHGDDGARDGRRDDGVPRRARLVGGRPVPPGPADPAGPAERARDAGADRGPHPEDRLARHVQRPRLRLAAARHPLPDGPSRPAGRTPATSTCCRSSAASSGTG